MKNNELIDVVQSQIDKLDFQFPYSAKEWINKNMVIENYHKHTMWSNLVQIDSTTSIHDFIKLSSEYGCECHFSGEHGYPGEWMHVYDVCQQLKNEKIREKYGILNVPKFIYSAEVYWVKDINHIEVEEYVDKKGEIKTREKRDNMNCHMIIIARNYQAIRKLNYIISLAHVEGFYYKPRIDLNMLFTLTKDDVYITSACVAGHKYPDSDDIWLKIARHFEDSFFFEYQCHQTEKQKNLNIHLYELSKQYGIKTIVGLDTHYINEEDRIKRENLLQRKGLHYEDEDGWYMDFPNGAETFNRLINQGVLPREEIIYAMLNTHRFTNGCEEIGLDTEFKIPILDEYRDMDYEQRSKELLEILEYRFSKEDDEHRDQAHHEGMLYEFREIRDAGVSDYFLTNQKLVNLAVNKYQGQLTTTSRGSASSYYTSKLLGFTTMDRFESEVPVYPERFITKDRILASHQMPDIDLNIAAQPPFVSAARELCGEHGCYPLLAVGKLGEKSGFKLYADINGIAPSVANDITTAIDQYNEAIKQVDDEEDKKQIHIEDYIENTEHLRVFMDSKPYQGIVEQAKCHACGHMVFNGCISRPEDVGYGDIRYEIGLIRCYSESTGKSTIVANIEGGLLDGYGYVKDDFLIVDVVGIIYKLYHSIGRDVPTVTELRKMVKDDQGTWSLYAMGATCCLNQCERASTTKKVMRYKPQSIRELSAFIAGIRPGFKSHIDNFVNRVPYTTGEKAIDDLLEDSFHHLLYQEGTMKVFGFLGIPIKESYDTIKKISKKKLKGEALAHVEDTLKEHWMKNIGNLDNFAPVYQVIKDSGRYQFNSVHSQAMCMDSLYEAWFKYHYTSKFYEVTLNHYSDKGDKNKIAELEKEAVTFFGYSISKYRYGTDSTKFTVDDKTKSISPNLSSIKGIGVGAAQDLRTINGKDFVELYLSCSGTKVNRTVFTNLIKIGYFEKFGDVSHLLAQVDVIDKWSGRSTVPKSFVEEIHIDRNTMLKYGTDITKKGNVSAKQYTITDNVGFCREICKRTNPTVNASLGDIVKWQIEILGYTDYINPEFTTRYVVVTDLDTTYSPKFVAYCLKNGKTAPMKIHNTIPRNNKNVKQCFSNLEVKNGDIVYMTACSKEPKKKKIDGKWTDVPGEFDWWLNDYEIVKTL